MYLLVYFRLKWNILSSHTSLLLHVSAVYDHLQMHGPKHVVIEKWNKTIICIWNGNISIQVYNLIFWANLVYFTENLIFYTLYIECVNITTLLVTILTTKPQAYATRSAIVDCPLLFIHYIRDFPPCMEAAPSINITRTRQAMVTSVVLHMGRPGPSAEAVRFAAHRKPLCWNFLYQSRIVLSVGCSVWYVVRTLRCTVTIDSVLANSKSQNAFLSPVLAMFRHDCPLTVKPASTPWRLLSKWTWRDPLPNDMLLSAVSILLVALPSLEIPEGLLNYIIWIRLLTFWALFVVLFFVWKQGDG
jgi:hypothetical protein